MTALGNCGEGLPPGDCHASQQAHGSLTFGARGATQAQRGCAPRDLLSSAPCACPRGRGPRGGGGTRPRRGTRPGGRQKASGNRTLGVCLEQRLGLLTVVPRTWAVRQALEAWGQHQGQGPLLLGKPGRTRQDPPRRWPGPSGIHPGAVAYADGRRAVAARRLLVVHSSPLAPQAAGASSAAPEQEAARAAAPSQCVEACGLA